MKRFPNYCEYIKLMKDMGLKASFRTKKLEISLTGPARRLVRDHVSSVPRIHMKVEEAE